MPLSHPVTANWPVSHLATVKVHSYVHISMYLNHMPILLINTPVQISNTKPDVYWDAAISPSSVGYFAFKTLYCSLHILQNWELCHNLRSRVASRSITSFLRWNSKTLGRMFRLTALEPIYFYCISFHTNTLKRWLSLPF